MDLSDLSLFFADFGVNATRTPVGGGAPSVLRGIFDAPWAPPQIGMLKTALSEPSFLIATADAKDAANGDTLALGGTIYTVVSVEPDSTGATVLVLR